MAVASVRGDSPNVHYAICDIADTLGYKEKENQPPQREYCNDLTVRPEYIAEKLKKAKAKFVAENVEAETDKIIQELTNASFC